MTTTRPQIICAPEDWKDLSSHEYANIFPLLPMEQLETTFPTMWSEGYMEDKPVVLYLGKILDGRNRLRAAIQSGRIPTFAELSGTDEEALLFVIQENLHRRHLNDNQRTIIATRIEPMFASLAPKLMQEGGRKGGKIGGTIAGRGRPKPIEGVVISPHPLSDTEPPKKPAPKSRDKAAAAVNVKPEAVGRAKTLVKERPDLAARVEAGELGVWEADRIRREQSGKAKPKSETLTQKVPTDVPDVAPDIAALLSADPTQMTIKEVAQHQNQLTKAAREGRLPSLADPEREAALRRDATIRGLKERAIESLDVEAVLELVHGLIDHFGHELSDRLRSLLITAERN